MAARVTLARLDLSNNLTDEEVKEYFVHVVGSMNMRYEGIRKKLIQVGGKLLKYFEEDNLHVLAGTDICFSVPVVDDLEVKICIIFSSNSLFSASPDDLEVKKWSNKTFSNVIAPL